MAGIDQLLLFFFTLKFCLKFSQHFTLDFFSDEIQAHLKEEEALMRGSHPSANQSMGSYFKGSKMFRKGFKHGASSAA